MTDLDELAERLAETVRKLHDELAAAIRERDGAILESDERGEHWRKCQGELAAAIRERDEWKEPWRIIAVDGKPFDGELHITPQLVKDRLDELTRERDEARTALEQIATVEINEGGLDRYRILQEIARSVLASQDTND